MTDRNETVRLAIYFGPPPRRGGFRPPASWPTRRAWTAIQVEDAMEELASARHLVFDSAHRIVLAHPFATRNFAFSVMGNRTLLVGRMRLGCIRDPEPRAR